MCNRNESQQQTWVFHELLGDPRQIASILWASVSRSIKWGCWNNWHVLVLYVWFWEYFGFFLRTKRNNVWGSGNVESLSSLLPRHLKGMKKEVSFLPNGKQIHLLDVAWEAGLSGCAPGISSYICKTALLALAGSSQTCSAQLSCVSLPPAWKKAQAHGHHGSHTPSFQSLQTQSCIREQEQEKNTWCQRIKLSKTFKTSVHMQIVLWRVQGPISSLEIIIGFTILLSVLRECILMQEETGTSLG